MPWAADMPTMPWCSTERSSRIGRKISMPNISTTSSAVIDMAPLSTRQAPTASAAAAPQAMALSVMPRAAELVASSHMVRRNRSLALDLRRRAVRHHGAGMLKHAAQHHDEGDRRDRQCQRGEVMAAEYLGNQPAQQCEARDAGGD